MKESKEFSKAETKLHRKLLMYEWVVGWLALVPSFTLIVVAGIIDMPDFARIILIILGILIFAVGIHFAFKIEIETGHYKCEKCGYEYVPTYSKALFAPHVGRTRYMKCPKCVKKSWQKKASNPAEENRRNENVILIHGFNRIPKIYYWLKDQLEPYGVEIILPSFPPAEGCIYEDWAKILDGYKDKIRNNSILVCHSIGNEFMIRYLSERNLAIDTYIGLAGFADKFYHEDKEILNIAVEKFKVSEEEKANFIKLANKRYAIYSDNDHVVPFDLLERYPKEINAEPIFIPGIGHMGRVAGLEELPELLKLVQESL